MARKTIADLKEGSGLWAAAHAEKGGQLTLSTEPAQTGSREAVDLSKIKPKRHGHSSKRWAEDSWCVVGIDTSMSSIAMCGIGYDGLTKKMTAVRFSGVRWLTEDDDYLQRLADAANVAHNALFDAITPINLPLERIFLFQEEPVPMGMMGRPGAKFSSAYIKQQCEISGAMLGALYKYGYKNIVQINNAQWKKTLRNEGVTIGKMPEGKWDIKKWAMSAYGLPDLPDLVKSKAGGKIPRPESGFGANAKAIQPDDIYDAAACMAYGCDFVAEHVV